MVASPTGRSAAYPRHLRYRKDWRRPVLIFLPMGGFLFRCPNTGRLVQGWSADDVQSSENSYELVSCLACTQLHFVNRATGKVLGSEVSE